MARNCTICEEGKRKASNEDSSIFSVSSLFLNSLIMLGSVGQPRSSMSSSSVSVAPSTATRSRTKIS